jgi:hypothetical protein
MSEIRRIAHDKIRYYCRKELENLGPYFRTQNAHVDKIWVMRMACYVLSHCGFGFREIAIRSGYLLEHILCYFDIFTFLIERNRDIHQATLKVILKHTGLIPERICNSDYMPINSVTDAIAFLRSVRVLRLRWPENTSEDDFAHWLAENYTEINRYSFVFELCEYLNQRGIDPETCGIMSIILKEKARRILLLFGNTCLTLYEKQFRSDFCRAMGIDENNFWQKYVVTEYLGSFHFIDIITPDNLDENLIRIVKSYNKRFMRIKKTENVSFTSFASQLFKARYIGNNVFDYILKQPVLFKLFPPK